jgi:anti-sigma factor RsiW
MIHTTASRRLAELVDGVLDDATEVRVRGHVQGCARCRRVVGELEAAETLLRGLPPSLVPLEASEAADARLAALARWASEPEPVWRERFGASAIGAFAAAAGLALVLMSATWTPLVAEPAEAATLAAVMPEATQYAPLGWR